MTGREYSRRAQVEPRMKDKIIKMPNGDGGLASRITCVGHVLRGSGGGPKPVEWGPKVRIGGVGTYDVQDDKTAVAERDRILAEWQAWLEGPTETGERAELEALTADPPDLMAITHLDDLRYLVRRFSHETGVRVGCYETIEGTTRELVGVLMCIKAREDQRRRG